MKFYKISSSAVNINKLKIIKSYKKFKLDFFHSSKIYRNKFEKKYKKKYHATLYKLSLNKEFLISSYKEVFSLFTIKKRHYTLFKSTTNKDFNNYSVSNSELLIAFNLVGHEKNINFIFDLNVLDKKKTNYPFLNKILTERSLNKQENSLLIFLSGSFGKTSVGFLLSNLLNDLFSNFSVYNDYFIISNNFIFNAYEKKFVNRHKLDQEIFSCPEIKNKYLVALSSINQFELISLNKCLNELGSKMSLIELASSKFNHRNFTMLKADVILFNNFSNFKSTALESKNSTSFKQVILDFLMNQKTLSVIDEEDPFSEKHYFHNSNKYLITYSSFDENSDIYSNKLSYSTWGTEMELETPIKNIYFETELIGRHNVHNILSVFSFGFMLNIPINYTYLLIRKIESIPDRMQVISYDLGQCFNISIDYSGTVEGISEIAKSISIGCQTKIYLVYGSSGNSDGVQNEASAQVIFKCTEKLFISTVNPKWINTNKLFHETIKGVSTDILYQHGGSVYDWIFELEKIPIWFQFWLYHYQNHANFYTFHDRSLAIRVCLAMAQKDDVLVISGRGGSEIYEKLDVSGKKVRYYYNDLKEIFIALEDLIELKNIKTKELPWKL